MTARVVFSIYYNAMKDFPQPVAVTVLKSGISTVVFDIEESRFLPMQGDIEVGPQWSAKPTRRKYTLLEDLLKAEIAML